MPDPVDTSPDSAVEPPPPAPPIVEEPSAPALVGRLDPSPLEPAVGMVPGTAATPVGPPAVAIPPVEVDPWAPTGVVSQVLAAAITGVTSVVQPEAAVAVAEEFTFPIALTVSVLAFLAVQGHIDRRDPKLRLAPRHLVEAVVRFEAEDEL
jgi:hypothetical protein